MTEIENPPNTIDRRIPEGMKAIDPTLRGEARQNLATWLKEKIAKRILGVIFVENPKSNVLLFAPHAQGFITLVKIDEVANLDALPHPWELLIKIGKAVISYSSEEKKG